MHVRKKRTCLFVCLPTARATACAYKSRDLLPKRNLLSAGNQWLLGCLYLAQSTHPPATMALPKYPCPCFKCNSMKNLAKRTILAHSKQNLQHLGHLQASGADQDTIYFVQECQNKILQLLNDLNEEVQSSRLSKSPDPDGECLILYSFIYLLIYDCTWT